MLWADLSSGPLLKQAAHALWLPTLQRMLKRPLLLPLQSVQQAVSQPAAVRAADTVNVDIMHLKHFTALALQQWLNLGRAPWVSRGWLAARQVWPVSLPGAVWKDKQRFPRMCGMHA